MLTADKFSINKSIQRIQSRIQSITANRILSSTDKTDINLEILSKSQLLFDQRFISNDIDKTLIEIIFGHGLKLERVFPGSFKTFINDFFEQYFQKSNIKIDSIGSIYPIERDLKSLFDELEMSSLEKSMIQEALELAGFNGKISFERSNEFFSIEKSCGYNFNVTCPILQKKVSIDDVHIVPIDGFIESVSEINKLLEIAYSDKQKIILIVRGMHDDVTNTLKINFDRGSLTVFPLIVPFDVDGINLLNDIAVVTNNDVVSSNKGDLISSINVSSFKRIENAIIERNMLTLFNKSSKDNVNNHINFLKRKREESTSTAVGELYTKRIKNLFSSHVIIRIPNDEKSNITSEKIDTFLRKFNQLLSQGNLKIRSHPFYQKTVSDCVESIQQLGMVLLDV